MTEHVHTVVIGAGVVGLAIARQLAQACGDVLVLERANAIGAETSSRNSEVVLRLPRTRAATTGASP